jgi:hypothetical protein
VVSVTYNNNNNNNNVVPVGGIFESGQLLSQCEGKIPPPTDMGNSNTA